MKECRHSKTTGDAAAKKRRVHISGSSSSSRSGYRQNHCCDNFGMKSTVGGDWSSLQDGANRMALAVADGGTRTAWASEAACTATASNVYVSIQETAISYPGYVHHCIFMPYYAVVRTPTAVRVVVRTSSVATTTYSHFKRILQPGAQPFHNSQSVP